MRLRRECTYVLLLIIAAACLRFWNLRQMEFKADEHQALDFALSILQSRPWATAAHWPQYSLRSSGGLNMPPLSNSLYALFWVLTRSPLGCTAILALLNVLSLPVLYAWARPRIGSPRALLTIAWLALSPYMVIHSRKLWSHELLLPAMTLVLWGVAHWLSGKYWLAGGLLVWAVLLVSQLHLSGPILLAALALSLAANTVLRLLRKQLHRLQRPRWWELLNIACGLAALLFFTVPYLRYLGTLSRNDFQSGMRLDWPEPRILYHLFEAMVPLDWSTNHFGSHFWQYAMGHVTWGVNLKTLRYVSLIGSIYTAIPLVAKGAAAWLSRPYRIAVLGSSWIVFVLLFSFLHLPAYTHYILVISPLAALMVGGGFEAEFRHAKFWNAFRWVHMGFLGILSAGLVGWVTHRGGSDGDYGIAYGVKYAEASALIAQIDGKNFSQLETGDRASLANRCHRPGEDVLWILGWLKPEYREKAARLNLCDGWELDNDGDCEFRWVLEKRH